jgi:hypothetical protein
MTTLPGCLFLSFSWRFPAEILLGADFKSVGDVKSQRLNSSTPELLLSDERSERSAAAHIELKLHDDTL